MQVKKNLRRGRRAGALKGARKVLGRNIGDMAHLAKTKKKRKVNLGRDGHPEPEKRLREKTKEFIFDDLSCHRTGKRR